VLFLLHIKIIAVGKLRERYLREGCVEYLRRLNSYAQVEVVEIKEETHGTPSARTDAEAKRITAALPARCHLIVLDERGKQFTSPKFARYLEQVAAGGQSAVCFVIGGADGVAPHFREQAQLLLSFSQLTFPHQLFRVLLLEQIYRVFTIQRGEPYHRAGLDI
jgi:23S rRNA (pseudouridine1915-N3)-methyltransferase